MSVVQDVIDGDDDVSDNDGDDDGYDDGDDDCYNDDDDSKVSSVPVSVVEDIHFLDLLGVLALHCVSLDLEGGAELPAGD